MKNNLCVGDIIDAIPTQAPDEGNFQQPVMIQVGVEVFHCVSVEMLEHNGKEVMMFKVGRW